MTATAPGDLAQLLDTLAERPETQLLAGGTDFMVEVNFGRRDPIDVVALRRVQELRGWARDGDVLMLHAGLTFTEMLEAELAALIPALAQSARTVGSPQIRNVGTLGGNLGTSSPAGDALPVLAALDAVVVLADQSGTRRVPFGEFISGPKRNALRPGEVILGAEVRPVRGPQEFVKVGTRNAMVISVASVALIVDADRHRVACALGSVAPTVLRATEAEEWIESRVDWDAMQVVDDTDRAEFARLVARGGAPDRRSPLDCRLPSPRDRGVRARRALARAL